MLRRILQLIIIILIVGIAVGLVLRNNQPILVDLGTSTIEMQSGVALLLAFTTGILLAALATITFGFVYYFKERRLKKQLKNADRLLSGLLEAREFAACGELGVAAELWNRLASRDRTEIIAHLELATVLERQGEFREALREIEEARALAPKNREILVRTAALAEKLNLTSVALDSLRILLELKPSRELAKKAAKISLGLGKLNDAQTYWEVLSNLGDNTEDASNIKAELEFKRVLDKADSESAEAQFEKVIQIVENYPSYSAAWKKLTEIALLKGRVDDAAKALGIAAKRPSSSSAWFALSELWLKAKDPARSVAAAKSALRDSMPGSKSIAAVELLKIYLTLDMLDEAVSHVEEIEQNRLRGDLKFSQKLEQRYDILRSLLRIKKSDNAAAVRILESLATEASTSGTLHSETELLKASGEPLPHLSTP